MENKVKIWAHRGAVEYAPENTLEAFEAAVKTGADGVELDIHLSKDREIVVIHDDRLERTSTGKGWVKDFTLSELRKLNYSRGSKFENDGRQYDIPTMREVFELLKPTGLTINVELKTNVIHYIGIEKKILQMAEEFGMSDRTFYSSFNHLSIEKIHLLDPKARVGFLYANTMPGLPILAKNLGIQAVHPSYLNLLSPDYMKDCRKNGLDVNVWTIDREDQMRHCFASGVNAIITNRPDKALEIKKEYEKEEDKTS